MAKIEMVMPKMGESIMEGTILSWLKKEGDTIEQDESVLEVATDKVDTEVPATHAGVLEKILIQAGEVAEVGKPIAIINTSGDADGKPAKAEKSSKVPSEESEETDEKEEYRAAAVSSAGSEEKSGSNEGRFYSPLVMNIARQENISMPELEKVPGTGKDGRVTKNDILAYIKNRAGEKGKQVIFPGSPQANPNIPRAPLSISAEDEIIEMDRMRKVIAERMIESRRISAHVSSFVEADLTGVVFWRNRMKNEFKEVYGSHLTFTPIFIEAVVKAIRDYPMINASVSGDNIIKRKAINIGMAVALPSGNLVVPVIHNADQLNLAGLTNKVNDLAKRARDNRLKPEEVTGGTYTISNVGSFGNVMGTPIIVQPQVAIMAFGAVVKKPSVIETPTGDAIAVRHKMFLSHSYDHRIIDGSLGGMFVRRVADYLERFDTKRGI